MLLPFFYSRFVFRGAPFDKLIIGKIFPKTYIIHWTEHAQNDTIIARNGYYLYFYGYFIHFFIAGGKICISTVHI